MLSMELAFTELTFASTSICPGIGSDTIPLVTFKCAQVRDTVWVVNLAFSGSLPLVNFSNIIGQGEATGKGKINYPNGISYLGT